MEPELRYQVYKRPMMVPVSCPNNPVRPQCYVTSYLITRFPVSLGVPNVYFPTGFLTKYINLEPRINATYSSLLILIYFVILIHVDVYEEFYFLLFVIFPVVFLDLRLNFTLLCNLFFVTVSHFAVREARNHDLCPLYEVPSQITILNTLILHLTQYSCPWCCFVISVDVGTSILTIKSKMCVCYFFSTQPLGLPGNVIV